MPGRSLLFRIPLSGVYGIHQQIPVCIVDHAVSVHISHQKKARMHAARLIIGKAADHSRGQCQSIRPVLYRNLLSIGSKARSRNRQYISPRFQVFKRHIGLGCPTVLSLLIRSQYHPLRFLPGQGNGKAYILTQIQCGKDLHIDLSPIPGAPASLFWILLILPFFVLFLFLLRIIFLTVLVPGVRRDSVWIRRRIGTICVLS